MPKFIVEKVLGEPREWGEAGREMLSYKLVGKLDGSDDMVEITTPKAKPKTPTVGEAIECTVEDSKYGKKIRRASQGFAGGFGGHSGGGRDPEVQQMIVRQNALSNAVAFFTAKATIEKKTDVLTTENILLVAQKFAAFSIGELKPKSITPVDPKQETLPVDDGDFSDVEQYMEGE